MKIDRQIGILSVLLQRETVTAPYLVEKFEVSRRTINRDIEDLCKAGIPIVTKQGMNGGISIIENYKIDKTLLTQGEMQDILAGLRSLDSVNGTNRYGQLMEKLSAASSDFMVGNQSVLIDLSSWYKDSLAPKIELIRTSIDKCRKLQFIYYSPKGESVRCIEPYYLIFRWSSWYVWEWCVKRREFRLFKLNRMGQVKISEQEFLKRQVPMPDLSDERIFPGGIKVKALFEQDCKWTLVEEFGTESFRVQQDDIKGIDYSNKDAFNWISVIRLPDFISERDFAWGVQTAAKKKKIDCSPAEFLTIDEGLCVQIMHLGSFDSEPTTVALMENFLKEQGFVNDLNEQRLHHEIYMSDARRVAPEKWKTVIRHPIKKA